MTAIGFRLFSSCLEPPRSCHCEELQATKQSQTWRTDGPSDLASDLSEILKSSKRKRVNVKLKVIVHEAEEGGYWAEVPGIPGCATQGDNFEEL
jgi:hypothetical protein